MVAYNLGSIYLKATIFKIVGTTHCSAIDYCSFITFHLYSVYSVHKAEQTELIVTCLVYIIILSAVFYDCYLLLLVWAYYLPNKQILLLFRIPCCTCPGTRARVCGRRRYRSPRLPLAPSTRARSAVICTPIVPSHWSGASPMWRRTGISTTTVSKLSFILTMNQRESSQILLALVTTLYWRGVKRLHYSMKGPVLLMSPYLTTGQPTPARRRARLFGPNYLPLCGA